MTPKCNKYFKMIGKKYFSMNGFKFWGRLAWSILKLGNCYSWMFIFSTSWGRIMPMKCYLKLSCLSCLCSHFLENSWALKVLFFRSFNCHSEPWSPPIRSMLQGHTPLKVISERKFAAGMSQYILQPSTVVWLTKCKYQDVKQILRKSL